jgi:transcriptional regulator with XRE-family HTH domain
MEIGEKIKQLRIHHGMTQEELANRSELSKGFISQIEREITSPSIATLMDILQCLGTDLKSFFSDKEDTQIVFSPKDYFEKIDSLHSTTINWIVPNAQKNRMEPILITLAPQCKTPLDSPHSGEEFGFIQKGSIIVHIGSEQYKAKKGETFYFAATKEHYLSNPNKISAEVLWISSPPSF